VDRDTTRNRVPPGQLPGRQGRVVRRRRLGRRPRGECGCGAERRQGSGQPGEPGRDARQAAAVLDGGSWWSPSALGEFKATVWRRARVRDREDSPVFPAALPRFVPGRYWRCRAACAAGCTSQGSSHRASS
jgi:hypothetical protein